MLQYISSCNLTFTIKAQHVSAICYIMLLMRYHALISQQGRLQVYSVRLISEMSKGNDRLIYYPCVTLTKMKPMVYRQLFCAVRLTCMSVMYLRLVGLSTL